MNKLIDLINRSKYIVAFTGAGISTESGIPDFRSTGGLYMTGEYDGYTPESILTRKTLRTNPKLVLKFYKDRLMRMVDKEPNRSHLFLTKLEESGKLKSVVTQNIDNLHRKSGTKNVFELHGNSTKFKCGVGCGNNYSYQEFLERLNTSDVPTCDCQMSYIRPDVVLFDEWLNDDVFDGALSEIQQADLLIVIGTSLIVNPAASLIREIKKDCQLVIINKDETPYDKRANLLIKENCGEILESIMKLWIEENS